MRRNEILVIDTNCVLLKLYARALLQLNRDQQAITLLREHAPPVAQDPEYHALLAALYQRAGRYDDAIALYRDLLQRNPHQALWWMGLAMALEASQRPANALSAYQQARSAGPGRHALMSFIEARIAALSHPQAADKQAQG